MPGKILFYYYFITYMSALTRMNVLKKPQLSYNISYVIEKGDSCFFCSPAEKAFISRLHLLKIKKLQLVHARNRPIQQLFVPFPVESNSHQYESMEWLPGL